MAGEVGPDTPTLSGDSPDSAAERECASERLLGRLLVDQGVVPAALLAECLAIQEAIPPGTPRPRLVDLLAARGLLCAAKPAAVAPPASPAFARRDGPPDPTATISDFSPAADLPPPTAAPPPPSAGAGAVRSPPPRAAGATPQGSAPPRPASALPADVSEARARGESDGGPYILVRELGRGGMGQVFKAWERELERFVALKWVSLAAAVPGAPVPADAMERFLREARTAAKLSHPNIVQVYGAGMLADRHYIASELVEGATFRRLIEEIPEIVTRKGSAPERRGDTQVRVKAASARRVAALRRRISVLRDVARALDVAHCNGVIHRDIKPDNILLKRPAADGAASPAAQPASAREPTHSAPGGAADGDIAWTPKLADFGLARDLASGSDLTRSGEALGTPAYMSPEQADGRVHEIGPASDLFSLGAVLYEAATGERPFKGESTASILFAVIDRDPPRPRTLVPSLSVDLETVILRCLEKNPARRYPSAAALADDLSAWLDGEPIRARPVSRIS
ncbi:MAG: serine/threonine protein kinase, partial [Planctomycetes bacterium]|nr:serine/threonine protein kinase [Planctomycetota bacterium]